jgi:hypothetical protein
MLRVTTGAIVRFNGCKIRLWKHREIDGRIKSGSFSQDARGRWYCNLVAEYEPKPLGKNAEVGIDGLKEGMTLSTDACRRKLHPRRQVGWRGRHSWISLP